MIYTILVLHFPRLGVNDAPPLRSNSALPLGVVAGYAGHYDVIRNV